MSKTPLAAALIAVALAASVMPATAVDDPSLNFAPPDGRPTFAPPAARYEAVPAPRAGYTWAPGYWNWNRSKHVWVGGHWERDRPGYVYRAPAWAQRDNVWVLDRGGWNPHDRDGDGIPNKYDAHPDNGRRR